MSATDARSPAGDPSRAPSLPPAPTRTLPAHPLFWGSLVVAAGGAALLAASWGEVAGALTALEQRLGTLLPEAWIDGSAWFLLPVVGFAAGLLASISPCILPLVPLNAALIGAADANGWRAAALSGRFVLGAALALAVLGLAADLAGFLLIEQRGPILIAVGLLLVYLALVTLELVPLPGMGLAPGNGRRLGPFAAGAAFALVTTPCASPLLAAVLGAAAAQQVPGLSVFTMTGFALGYTALVFVAGVFGGNLVRRLRTHDFEAPRAIAAAVLLVAGLGFQVAGAAWF